MVAPEIESWRKTVWFDHRCIHCFMLKLARYERRVRSPPGANQMAVERPGCVQGDSHLVACIRLSAIRAMAASPIKSWRRALPVDIPHATWDHVWVAPSLLIKFGAKATTTRLPSIHCCSTLNFYHPPPPLLRNPSSPIDKHPFCIELQTGHHLKTTRLFENTAHKVISTQHYPWPLSSLACCQSTFSIQQTALLHLSSDASTSPAIKQSGNTGLRVNLR